MTFSKASGSADEEWQNVHIEGEEGSGRIVDMQQVKLPLNLIAL